ncbi:STAS domain-containing protein [Pseudoflavonifractor intestinihominis]|uniref:Anti-sigma factor antagonist n=1 Tax=Pseudoflavonifractor intestinihominis TaxID=3133171 RepID=A0ABV1E9A9_9FIRM|nr:STAS domain-containing protein [uncultured Pseudoflavonifractor sp.]
MSVTCTGEDRNLRLTVSGEVDHHGARAIMQELDRQVDAGLPRRLTLDLSGVTFMDSSGIAVLLRAYRRMAELGGALTVANVPPQALKVLRAAGLERIIRFE